MRTPAEVEPAALDRLCAGEAVLEASLARARAQADETVAAARLLAGRQVAEARGQAADEERRQRDADAAALALALDGAREDSARALQGLDAASARHRERALRLVLDAVLGEAP